MCDRTPITKKVHAEETAVDGNGFLYTCKSEMISISKCIHSQNLILERKPSCLCTKKGVKIHRVNCVYAFGAVKVSN